jgi:type II secretory pathway component PulK
VSVGAARQSGTAIALVMWLLSVMTITVAGVVSLSRDDVSLAEAQLTTAKAYYLGKGVARLVMRDRVLSGAIR